MRVGLVPVALLACWFELRITPAQEGGGAAAMATLTRLSEQPIDAQMTWQASKKLSADNKIPASPAPRANCMDPANLLAGKAGLLECWQFQVLQVIGPEAVLLQVENSRVPPLSLEGYPTKGLAEGEKVRLIGPIHVAGIKSYAAAGGASRTLNVVKFATPNRLAQSPADQAEQNDAAATAAKVSDEPAQHKFTDSTGKFTINGIFLEVKQGSVVIRKVGSGETVGVPLSRLSKNDQEWVRDANKARLAKDKDAAGLKGKQSRK